jgi:hypothetical protein
VQRELVSSLKAQEVEAECARRAPKVFWEDVEGLSPLEIERVQSSEEIAQGVCRSGLIPSPKAQER